MFYPDPFDVIIIGGGHAGTEAAMAAARMGLIDSAFDTQYRHSGADELQPGDRRYWEGTSGKRSGCTRRSDGESDRSSGYPV